jgi:hypothetical protein
VNLSELIQQRLEEADFRRAHDGRSREEQAEWEASIDRELYQEYKDAISRLPVNEVVKVIIDSKGWQDGELVLVYEHRWEFRIDGYWEDYPWIYVKLRAESEDNPTYNYIVNAKEIHRRYRSSEVYRGDLVVHVDCLILKSVS